MLSYDYGKLKSKEFENLISDIIDIRDNKPFEIFGSGKDKGIDSRYEVKKTKIIVQAKICNYSPSQLLSKLEREELPKVEKLNPSRYILAVSCPLLPENKDKIFDLFKGYIKYKKDILCSADLDKLLRKPKYDSVLNNYPNLWMPRVNKLRELLKQELNKPVINKTVWMLDELPKIKRYFVRTRKYDEFLEYLDTHHTIFITGDPSSGKTTNAKMLSLELMENKKVDEVYLIQNLEEIYSLYEKDKRQLFLLDDYWGSTFEFNKRGLNEEKNMIQILEKIESSSKHYLILTTREYVLDQIIKMCPELKITTYKNRKFYLLKDYNDAEKAEILYRHAYEYNLNEDTKMALYKNTKDIIKFPNYNPRLVNEYIKNNYRLETVEFMNDLIMYLREPTEYFNQIFSRLSIESQILSFILAISNPPILIEDLKNTFDNICKYVNNIKPSDFKGGIEELENSFTLTTIEYDDKIIDFRNHSIHDFINDKLKEFFLDYKDAFIRGLNYCNQLENISLENPLKLDNDSLHFVTNRLIEEFDSLKYCAYEDYDILGYSVYHSPDKYQIDKIFRMIKLAIYNSNIKNFVEKRIKDMFNHIDSNHSYRILDFESLPEIVDMAEKIGAKFDKEEICRIYLTNSHYLSDIFYASFFPSDYKKYIREVFKIMNEIAPIDIMYRIEYDIEDLYKRELNTEVYIIVTEIKTILNLLGIKYTKEIENLLKTYEENKPNGHKETKAKRKRRSSEERALDEIIEESKEWLFNDFHYDMNLNKLTGLIKKNKLNKVQEKLIRDNLLLGIFSFIDDSSEKYCQLVIEYLKEKNISTLSIKNYDDILNYAIKNKPTKEKLYYFAYDYLTLEEHNFIETDLLDKYNLTSPEIKNLLKNGLLIKYKKWFHISDYLLLIYLTSMYAKNNSNTISTYESILYTSIRNIYTLYFIEKFIPEEINNTFIIPKLDEIFSEIKNPDQFINRYGILEYYNTYESVNIKNLDELLDTILITFLGDEFSRIVYKIIKEDEIILASGVENTNEIIYDLRKEIAKNRKGVLYSLYEEAYEILNDIYTLLKENKGKNSFYDNW